MNWRTLFASGPTAWAAGLLIPGLVLFGGRNTDSAVPYWESLTAQSTVSLGFVTAVCGACAAWEGARLESARIWDWAPARNPLRIAVEHLTPVALLGLTGLLTALVTYYISNPAPTGRPSAPILGTACLVVLSHVAVGFVVGRTLHRLLGAALMLVVGYLWGFWPAALSSPAWLRHLNGQGVGECCTLAQEASARSLAATAFFSTALIAGALAALLLRSGTFRISVAGGATLACIAASVALAVPLGFDGTQQRDPAALKCTGDRPRICLWPEQQPHEDEFTRTAESVRERLEAVGVELPERIEYSLVKPREADLLRATATSVLPGEPPACARVPNARYPGYEAAGVIYAWLTLTAGTPPHELSGQWPPEELQLAQQVRELPVAAQKAWFERNIRSVEDCAVTPELSPASFHDPTDGRS
ncbi:hypothetical protein [Streptomyces sp. JJ38]|uniref:DUF7224 domain-containing protein n=1 Tax=Streptomyces sp. JJ38 TaxID=2738128 RepID=UPI001C56D93E|nr:hypothetical protein [Streptomyces sp. JJ38]MBW1597802.1 hypothetical protein [Streptomyces sp. JJ38]